MTLYCPRVKRAVAFIALAFSLNIALFTVRSEAEALPAYGIQSVNGVELGMSFKEASEILKDAGFTGGKGKQTCLESTQAWTRCDKQRIIAGKKQTGEKVTFLAEQRARFENNEISVDLYFTPAAYGAAVYAISRKEKFGEYVVDFEPVHEQIKGRIGPIYNEKPCHFRQENSVVKSFILDADMNYVKVGAQDIPPFFCNMLAFAPINGTIIHNARWVLAQPKGSVKYQAHTFFSVAHRNEKINSFTFEIIDHELAAQFIMAENLAALEKLTPEKNLSSDF